jgi:hypothetical protein
VGEPSARRGLASRKEMKVEEGNMSTAAQTLGGSDIDQQVRSRVGGTQDESIVSSPKRIARLAGIFYLMVGITGGFSEGYVDPMMYVAGNAAATAASVVANAGLARIGVLAHLADAAFFISTALTLYVLLKHVHKSVARAMFVFVVIAASVITLNAVFLFEGLQVATDSFYASAFGAAGASGIVMILIEIQHYGTLAAQVFFGLWLAPLGYLAYKSGLFPKALGVILVMATVSYVVDVAVAFASPELSKQVHTFLIIAPVISEVWMVLYLLVKGVRTLHTADRAPVAPTAQATVAR